MKEAYLELKDLTKSFGNDADKVVAVDHINLQVKEGDLVTLLGPSGCGKTTTLRMIAGFHTPTGGDVYIDGVSMNQIPPNKRPTAMVFQNYALFPHMTVFENIAYGLRIRKESNDEVKRKVEDIMRLIGLENLGDRQPRQLSGGQQQRVSLARALVMEPKVLLFDEPLSNLDAKLRVSTRLEIRKLQQRVGITSVYVTHDQEEAMTLSDKVVIMDRGLIQQVGSPAEIYSHPVNRFVAGFIGKANFLQAVVDSVESEQLVLQFLGKKIVAPRWNKEIKTGDEVLIVARPESILPEHPNEELVEGVVVNSVYFGSQMLYEVELPDHTVLQIEVADPQYHPIFTQGQKVGLAFKDRSLHVLPMEK
ncbi:ABC transporter ATP-binding protein [Sphaerochaeta sp.]|uniref:ABC transporter ATP-binding protein n=1 Tax=Sphaerochaeta sp. TaxID=1972642 RepID=UPI00258BBC9A|nr:ABC transporter ATP-binding protein [Sphaerochaeta sp.]MDD3424079.1 ABC transporter ATP-binding protein [Sphaerochaeta sp.]